MKRLKRAPTRAEAKEMLEDGLWVLRQLPGIGVREISFMVRSPELLALGGSPVVAEVKKGRLLARTQRKASCCQASGWALKVQCVAQ